MITDQDMSAVFHALSHESRRQILDILRDRPGCPVGELARHFDVSRIAVMNHLAVLEQAGLVVSEKEGRVRRLWLNAAPLQMIQDRWLGGYTSHFASRVTQLKYAAEAAARKEEESE
ncbi:MAG TPA: metalloregulator ArsR/SmtB family transcription factor [Hyphomonas sp.]|nr:metalloregulator ArsR/SmtB family transcription factor [Hyphomonas sp.]